MRKLAVLESLRDSLVAWLETSRITVACRVQAERKLVTVNRQIAQLGGCHGR